MLHDLNHLSSVLREFVNRFGERAMQIEDVQNSPDMTIRCSVRQNNSPGRPAFIISRVQLETLIDLGYTYSTISRMSANTPQSMTCQLDGDLRIYATTI